MAQLPTIYLIHASDASQHLGKLKEILQKLKAENRITDFTTWDIHADLASLADQVREDDLVLTLLTYELEPRKEEIESMLREVKTRTPGLKIAEIIVDHVPYENEFITFPADLKPIRSREDMDAVWNDIEQSLKDIFPVQEAEPVPPTDWKKYVKYAILLIVLLIALLVWRPWQPNSQALIADFTTNRTECEAPCTVDFTNTSKNADTYEWNFGDGQSSSEKNPSHTYDNAANYTVTLVVQKNDTQERKSQLIKVLSGDSEPEPPSFQVNAVNASVDNSNFSGTCPHQFNFTGKIEVNKAGTVKYTWLRSDGATAPVQTLNFEEAGSQTVSTSWTLGGAGNTYNNLWQQVKIVEPNEMLSNKAVFNLTCEAPVASIDEDCLPFNYQNVRAQPDGSGYLVTDGSSRMMVFRTREKAEQAVDIIKHYKLDKQCFAIRPQAGLRYFIVQGDIPSGSYSGEDCIRINNPQNLTIRETSNTLYQILDGNHIPFAAKSRAEAEKIIEIVKHYNAQYTCYVERPDPGMVYLRK